MQAWWEQTLGPAMTADHGLQICLDSQNGQRQANEKLHEILMSEAAIQTVGLLIRLQANFGLLQQEARLGEYDPAAMNMINASA